MTYKVHATDALGRVVECNYNSDGKWVGEGPDPKEMVFWRRIRETSVTAELVKLASERSGIKVEFRPDPSYSADLNTSNPWDGQLWATRHPEYKGAFTDELDRLQKLVTRPLDERELRDDEKMFGGYIYVVDGQVRECEHFNGESNAGITVAEYRRRYNAHTICRFDMYGRKARQPKPERSDFDRHFRTQIGDDLSLRPSGWSTSGRRMIQRQRKPRSSNKIKKVK
jgi:hypothetical protein